MPVSWQELQEPRAVVNPGGGRGPADGPDPASTGSGAELAWFGDRGKGPSPCPVPALRGECGIPNPSPRIALRKPGPPRVTPLTLGLVPGVR